VSLSERDQRRARTSLPIARMARTREFRDTHPHELTFITVLPDDTVEYLLTCLDTSDSPAVLAMLTDDGVRLVSLTPEPTRPIQERPRRKEML
jgi:hypothetical protein